jgi:hypothetical protein
LGWLLATPKSEHKKKGAKIERVSNIRKLHKDDPLKKMPEMHNCSEVFDHFQQLGLCKSNGYGRVPIDYQDLAAYMTIHKLTNWEADTVIKMSRAFIDGNNLGEKFGSQPPYTEHYEEHLLYQRLMISEKRKKMFAEAAKKKPQ